MSIILFNKVCLYNELKEETTVYGQYNLKFDSVLIENTIYRLVFCPDRPDFYIKINGKPSKLNNITFLKNLNIMMKLEDISLVYPFETCDLNINVSSAIISTICKDYSHRLDEWIKYNLRLGFSGIVIFNNDSNTRNGLHESLEYCVKRESTEEICKKYKGSVFVIDMPYSNLPGGYWTDIQRITLHIGVNAFRRKCRNIALIDADEFIYIPNDKNTPIDSFLRNHSTITMKSNILTNKNDNNLLNNNILELANYIGEDKYTKTILHTDKINEDEFIVTPHNHPTEKIMNKNDIIHYHCWMNKRYKYNESMISINL